VDSSNPLLTTDPGDVSAGTVGVTQYITLGFASPGNSTTTLGVQTLAYDANTEITDFTGLRFKAISAGTTTLTMTTAPGDVAFFANSDPGEVDNNGNITGNAAYTIVKPTASDTVTTAPNIVFNVTASGHPIISLTTAVPASNYGTTITNGTGANQGSFSTGTSKLTVAGHNSQYLLAQATNIKTATGATGGLTTGNIEANGFNPATDAPEIFALEVLNGVAAPSQANLTTLALDINASNVAGLSNQTIASATAPANDPFSSEYNLFLTIPSADLPAGTTGDNFLGFDLSQDANFPTYTVAEVAVIPEPASVGIVAMAAAGLVIRRRNKKA
jgi:hypothetical protein